MAAMTLNFDLGFLIVISGIHAEHLCQISRNIGTSTFREITSVTNESSQATKAPDELSPGGTYIGVTAVQKVGGMKRGPKLEAQRAESRGGVLGELDFGVIWD